MAILKCKMCGGDLDLGNGASTAQCSYCGSVQTVPIADNEKKLTLFARAGRLRAACEFDKAAGIYESIVADFPGEAEAYWGLVLCKYGIEYVDDPATGKKIPTCHRSSFTSILDDADLEQALENADTVARKLYREEARQIEELRKRIIAVSSSEAAYDIFICYKETDEKGERTLDSVLAQDLYDALTAKNYRVFFARISLEDKLGQEYEPYIFAALNSAKVMLAVGTDYDHFHAVWVKNEWSRFLKLMVSDPEKHLIPCFKGLDAYDMPREFTRLQAQDLGKVGAVQDLLRGIEKLIHAATPAAATAPASTPATDQITALLDRGNMALEDGDWAKADSFFENVLNKDSKNAPAYFGKTLVLERCRTAADFWNKRKELYLTANPATLSLQPDEAHIAEIVKKYTLPGYVPADMLREPYSFDLTYRSYLAARQQQLAAEENYWKNHKLLTRAEAFATDGFASMLQSEKKAVFDRLSQQVAMAKAAQETAVKELQQRYRAFLSQADSQAEKLYEAGLQRRENNYRIFVTIAKGEYDQVKLLDAAKALESLGNFRDSKEMAAHCRQRVKDTQQKQAEEAIRRALLLQQQKQARRRKAKKLLIIFSSLAVVIATVLILLFTVIIPSSRFDDAEQLMEQGRWDEAAAIYQDLDGYDESENRLILIRLLPAFESEGYHIGIQKLLSSGFPVSVRYDSAGGEAIENCTFQNATEFAGLPDATREGYRFLGWEFSGLEYRSGAPISLLVTARWTDQFLIHYELDGGSHIGNPEQYRKEGQEITLKRPTKQGYDFLGWTGTGLDGMTLDVTIPAGSYGDRTYTAHWEPCTYQILLNPNGGQLDTDALTVRYGEHYTLPTPTREHYRFEGWYADNTKYTNGRWDVPGNVQLTARWTPVRYSIQYHMGGGVNPIGNPSYYTVTTGTISLQEPTRGGCKFLGWYTDAACTQKITQIPSGSSGDLHLYAKWELINYTITYVLNGGTISGTKVTTFTIEDLPLELPTASKSGMVFLHWALSTWEGAPISEITQADNITLVACFMDPNLQMQKSGSTYYVSDYSGSATSIVIPAYFQGLPVTKIGSSAFYGCTSLVTVTIPSTITKIESSAFNNCSSLKNITIPNSVTSIGSSAFSSCTSLTSIKLPNSIDYIGDEAFDWCTNLASVQMPETLSYLGDSAFSFCRSLRSIRVPEGVTSLGFGVFYDCTSLTSVTLPSTLKSIGSYVFNNCSSLTKIIIPASVTSMRSPFPGCSKLTIYCRVSSIPSGWSGDWNGGRPVVWGYTGN